MQKVEEAIFYTLEQTIKVYRQYAQKQIKEADIDITIDQWLLLNTIQENKDFSQHEIAEKIFKDIASVTRIIELLVKKGYIERKFHQTDRRRFELLITNKGQETIEKVKPIVLKYRKQALQGIKVSDIEVIKNKLLIIFNNCK